MLQYEGAKAALGGRPERHPGGGGVDDAQRPEAIQPDLGPGGEDAVASSVAGEWVVSTPLMDEALEGADLVLCCSGLSDEAQAAVREAARTAVLPQVSGPTSSDWFQLCPITYSVLVLATFTLYLPPWTSNESRPKNTVSSPASDVSHPAGIQSAPGRRFSKPGFASRFFGAAAGAASAEVARAIEQAARTSARIGCGSTWPWK